MRAESLVRKLDRLNADSEKLEDFRRDLRLGRGVELARIRLRTGIFGFGWTVAEKVTPMPDGMEAEFYDFLGYKQGKVGEKIRRVRAELEALHPEDQGDET